MINNSNKDIFYGYFGTVENKFIAMSNRIWKCPKAFLKLFYVLYNRNNFFSLVNKDFQYLSYIYFVFQYVYCKTSK